MFDVDKFLDRAKKAAGVESDYALGVKILGHASTSTMSNWRAGRSAPDERAIMKLCELTGDDPVDVAVRIQSMRAANDDAADLWRRVAERLGSVGAVLLPAFVAYVALASWTGFDQVGDASASAPLLITSNLVLLLIGVVAVARLAWRLYVRTRIDRAQEPYGRPHVHSRVS